MLIAFHRVARGIVNGAEQVVWIRTFEKAKSLDRRAARCCQISDVAISDPAPGAIDINGALAVRLKADRDASGDGRVYSIEISCADASGNTSSAIVAVLVPHDTSQN